MKQLLRDVARFADSAAQRAVQTDQAALIDDQAWAEFRASGLAMAPFPVELGGCGLWETQFGGELCIILRMLGAADLSFARLFEGHLNAIGLVCRYGSEHQTRDLAESVAQGALSAVWGADDAQGLHIVAATEGDILQGRKVLASGAGFVTRPLVIAYGAEGQQMCLLDLEAGYPHDISGWQAQGMRATATGTVDFSGRPVTARERVGSPGDYMRQPHFSGGAWRFCAAHVGATERLVDLFRDHLNGSGRGDNAYQLERLAICFSSAKTARFWIEDAAARLANDADAETVVAITNFTRMVVERCALDVMETVQRGIGLRALVRPHDVERICRDLATYLRQPAPDGAMSDAAKAFLASPAGVGEF